MEDIGAINFDNVTATADKGYTRPGVIDIFKITKVEFGNSKNAGTPGMTLTFENLDSFFSHTFYLRGKTPESTKTMLGRVQALLGYIHGEAGKLTGSITGPILTAKLKDKELALKVVGKVSDQGKGFADLSFGGFGKNKSELSFLRFTAEEERLNTRANDAIESSRASRSDSENSSVDNSAQPETFENAPVQTENF